MAVKCEKCQSEKVQRNGPGRRSGNWWYEPYKCKDCGHKFEKGEEIKSGGN